MRRHALSVIPGYTRDPSSLPPRLDPGSALRSGRDDGRRAVGRPASLYDPAAFARVLLEMRGARSAGPSIRISGKVKRPGAPRSAILGTPVLLSGTKGPTGIGAITPPIPRGKVAPPFAGTLVAPSRRAEFPSSRGQVFHPVRRAGLPLSAGAGETPPPAKPEGFSPPTYAPRHPQRVHRGSPFSFAP